MKNLIIVESPAKARTIGNFLGKEYKVVASKGHIRDLPKNSFGITIDENGQFIPSYSIPQDASTTVKELKRLAKEAETVFIATDEDREGEAIGFHIAVSIDKDPAVLPRIVFHEITKNAIFEALKHPRRLDMNNINAQQTRRLLDRMVGYKLSPLLGSKIQKGLSAGRVQSSTLKIIVDREREIQAFKPVEYWSVDAIFKSDIEALIYEYNGDKIEKLTIGTQQLADEIVAAAKSEQFSVASVEQTKRKTKPAPPFMTSTLQQSASTQLGFSPKKTMIIAQKLYEGVKTDKGVSGVITYMRTDSLNLSKEAVFGVRDFIQKIYGDEYLPSKPRNYVTKAKAAQEAHEAIRPTMIEFTPKVAASYLLPDELKLYRLIYNRFLACQMVDAEFESQTIFFTGDKTSFKASGSKLLFDGFYRAGGYSEKDKLLPELQLGQLIELQKIGAQQHFTEPPPRYNEASLIKKLESMGIGRPSTYAPTITILQTRHYIEIEKKQILPTEIAFTVTELLERHFTEIVDSSFTSKMEDTLDMIGEGKEDWQNVLADFYGPFLQQIEAGKTNIKSLKTAIATGEVCPECGGELLLRKGNYGEFIACGNFPKCKYTKNTNADKPKEQEETQEVCDKCGAPMVIKSSKRGKFLACSAYPKCKNAKPLTPPKTLSATCPECGGTLQERDSKRGKFFGCTNYPKCKFIANFEPVDKKCPKCNYTMGKKTLRGKEVFECFKCKHREND